MALTAASKHANILKSLNVYFHTNLVTADSLQVHFPGTRDIFTPTGATWVKLDYLIGIGQRQYMGIVTSNSETGSIVAGIINLNCCELIDQRVGVSYGLASIRDTVRARVTEGTAISIKDYDTVGNPGVGFFVCLDLTENEVQNGHMPDDNGIAIWNLSVSGEYVEAYS